MFPRPEHYLLVSAKKKKHLAASLMSLSVHIVSARIAHDSSAAPAGKHRASELGLPPVKCVVQMGRDKHLKDDSGHRNPPDEAARRWRECGRSTRPGGQLVCIPICWHPHRSDVMFAQLIS